MGDLILSTAWGAVAAPPPWYLGFYGTWKHENWCGVVSQGNLAYHAVKFESWPFWPISGQICRKLGQNFTKNLFSS